MYNCITRAMLKDKNIHRKSQEWKGAKIVVNTV